MSVFAPNKSKDGKRRYGVWAGDPAGRAEDTTRCIEKVQDPVSRQFYQCSRRRGYGPNGEFCKQHGKKAEALSPKGGTKK
jgi:hypothetical protein